jgi:probable blue pigment (indigoidine) exporter
MFSMESNRWQWPLLTAVAPVAWGSTYIVTEQFLPPDRPMFAAVMRALPAGLVLLAVRRELPHGDWWWKAVVLGVCNIGMFFPLLFLAAYHLPGGLAATLQATSPLAVMALAWLVIGERAGTVRVLAAVVGLAGVCLLVLRNPGGVDVIGLVGVFGSVVVSAIGFVLIKKWPAPVPMLTLVSWQLVVGGLVLVPVALLVEGAPPALDGRNLAGFVWLGGMGTVVAYCCWFGGLTRMSAGAVSLIGLVNPVVGTVLGLAFAGEAFGWSQGLGMLLVLGGVIAGQLAGGVHLRRRRATGLPRVIDHGADRRGDHPASRQPPRQRRLGRGTRPGAVPAAGGGVRRDLAGPVPAGCGADPGSAA